MFSQSYCVPNKKQSIFATHSPQNMGLLRNLTSKSYEADNISINFEASKKSNNNSSFSTRTNIMDLVFSFTDTSKMKSDRRHISTFLIPDERSKLNCKEIITHCNTMTTLPLARSYLVGGFVGSKSQLGRRQKDIRKFNLWDIIRDVVDLVGNSPANFTEKENHSSSSFEIKSEIMQNNNMQEEPTNNNSSFAFCTTEESMSSPKQSYADVAKRPTREQQSVITTTTSNIQPSVKNSEGCCNPMSVIEPIFSSCNITNFSNRDRITSECSADSEESFIVFECCEDDNVDKDIDSSDDETLSYLIEVSQYRPRNKSLMLLISLLEVM